MPSVTRQFVAVLDGRLTPYALTNDKGFPLFPGQLETLQAVYVDGKSFDLNGVSIVNGSEIQFANGERLVYAPNKSLFVPAAYPEAGQSISWTGTYKSLTEIYGADNYVDLITSEHRVRPKYTALVSMYAGAFSSIGVRLGQMPQEFDIDTATGVQLDAVGEWVGLARIVRVPIDNVYFEWDDADSPTVTGWGHGIWRGRFESGTQVQSLSDSIYRRMLKAKALINQWSGDIPTLYDIFNIGFGSTGARCEITETGAMAFNLNVVGDIPTIDKRLLDSGYLPLSPAGITMTVTYNGS